MSLDTATIDGIVDELLNREIDRRDGGKITDDYPGLDLETAYRVQDVLIERRLARGELVVGVKLGLTSRAKQRRMGVDSPLTAVLTDVMQLAQGAPVGLSGLIHPRVEPEIVFVMAKPLSGPGVTAASALAAVRSVHAGLEVIDSRYTNFVFDLPDVVADNASSALFVMSSDGRPPSDLDLFLEAAVLSHNGEVVDTATGAAVQGHPAEALALAANALGARGQRIEAGAIVLTGGMTDAVAVKDGDDIRVEFTNLPALSLAIGDGS